MDSGVDFTIVRPGSELNNRVIYRAAGALPRAIPRRYLRYTVSRLSGGYIYRTGQPQRFFRDIDRLSTYDLLQNRTERSPWTCRQAPLSIMLVRDLYMGSIHNFCVFTVVSE